MAVRRLCGGGRLYGVGLIDLTLEVTLPASLALLVLSSLSWRMPAGAEERAALSTRACTHLRSSVERQAYSHVKAGTCVSSRVRRSRIITWLKGRHALHDLLVIYQHADRCALVACARRHVGDTTISNRVRPAAHHDAIVHLVPRYWLQVMIGLGSRPESLCAFFHALHLRWGGSDNSLSQPGVNNQVFDQKPPNFAPKLERFTENAEGFTITALCHCFLSGFGHRVCECAY